MICDCCGCGPRHQFSSEFVAPGSIFWTFMEVVAETWVCLWLCLYSWEPRNHCREWGWLRLCSVLIYLFLTKIKKKTSHLHQIMTMINCFKKVLFSKYVRKHATRWSVIQGGGVTSSLNSPEPCFWFLSPLNVFICLFLFPWLLPLFFRHLQKEFMLKSYEIRGVLRWVGVFTVY